MLERKRSTINGLSTVKIVLFRLLQVWRWLSERCPPRYNRSILTRREEFIVGFCFARNICGCLLLVKRPTMVVWHKLLWCTWQQHLIKCEFYSDRQSTTNWLIFFMLLALSSGGQWLALDYNQPYLIIISSPNAELNEFKWTRIHLYDSNRPICHFTIISKCSMQILIIFNGLRSLTWSFRC